MKIVVLEPLGVTPEKLERITLPLKERGHQITFYSTRAQTAREQISRAQEANVLVIANQPLKKEVLQACPQLKLISVAFTGVDHVDTSYAQSRGISVCNAAGYSTHAAAELAISLALALLRHGAKADRAVRAGQDKSGLLGRELYGKTFAIVGTGAIGGHTAQLAKAFGCRVIAYSRTPRPQLVRQGVTYMPLNQLLQEADILSLHLPLTPETKNLIGEKELELMKPSALLINTARGPLVDQNALRLALQNKRLAGAGIDVFDQEPPLPPAHPLLGAPNTLLTPHIGFYTQEALVQRAQIVFENILKWEDKTPQNQII